jgi:diacylglycerol kinase
VAEGAGHVIKNMEIMNSDKFSFRSRLESFKFAFSGLWSLVKNEHNSRVHILAATIAILLGIVFKINSLEWCLIILLIGIVFLTELLNTSLEKLSDIVNPQLDERIRKVKDYAAAAVLISAIISIAIAGLIFIPKIVK